MSSVNFNIWIVLKERRFKVLCVCFCKFLFVDLTLSDILDTGKKTMNAESIMTPLSCLRNYIVRKLDFSLHFIKLKYSNSANILDTDWFTSSSSGTLLVLSNQFQR